MQDKIHKSLQFSQNDVWDTVLTVIDTIVDSEVDVAISQDLSNEARAHQCGRADGARAVKSVLLDLYEQANYERYSPKTK